MRKLLLLLCLIAQTGFSQSHQVDSLKRELVRLKTKPESFIKDTLTFKTVKAVMRLYQNINIDSSIHYNALLIKLCKSPNLQKERIYAYQFAGYINQLKGDYYQSTQFYFEALALAKTLKQYVRIASINEGLAHAYIHFGEKEKALKFCLQGLDILHRYPDNHIKLAILNVLGVIYREQGKLPDALKTNLDMYNLAKTEGDQWYEAHGLHAVGLVYKEMGDMTKAIQYHRQALPLSHQTGSVELEGNILINIADLYIRQTMWQQALVYCQKAKKMAASVNNSSIIMESEEKLHTIYKQTGEPQKALTALETYYLLKDNLSEEKAKQRIAMLQSQYDNLQKTNTLQQQVRLLAEKNRNQQLAQTRNGLLGGIVAILLTAALLIWHNNRLKEKNSELTRKNEEIKNALFKGQTIERKRVAIELHDNLSSLLSAVNMSIQSINPQNLSDSEQTVYQNVKHLIQNAYTEVRNISHNILPAELEREGLSATLTTLVSQLNQNSPLTFSLSITGLHKRLPIEIEFNVYSILLELINNAIKHANATTVSISLLGTNVGIDVFVRDNGIGIGQRIDKRGVGLQNVQARLESLGGTFTIVLPADGGTQINIKIPVETHSFNRNALSN